MTRFFASTVFLALTAVTVCGQTDKKKIISSFEKVDYYPDSTIKCVYKIKKGLYCGYAIEFDSTGSPIKIGKYRKGKRNGLWRFSNLAFTIYDNGESGLIAMGNYDYIPERQKAINDYYNLYYKLIHSKQKSRIILKP